MDPYRTANVAPRVGELRVRRVNGVLVEVIEVDGEGQRIVALPYAIMKGPLRHTVDAEHPEHPDRVWVAVHEFRDVEDGDLVPRG